VISSFDVQRQEWSRLLPITAAYGLVMASLYVLKPARNALFLDRLGVGQLPVVLVLVALIGGVAALVFSRFTGRVRLDRLVFFTFLLLGSCLLAFRAVLPLGWGWTYYLFYVWVNLYGLMATSLLWLLANALFNAREGRRLFGIIGTAGIAGAIVGGIATGQLVGWTGTENLLLVCAVIVGLCLLLLYPVRVRDTPAGSTGSTGESPLQTVRASQLLRLLAGMAALAAAVAAIIDVQFNQIVDQAFGDKDAKTAFFGRFFAGLSFFALLFQVFLAPRVLRSVGVTSALMFLPVSMALGSLAVLVVPGLAAGILLKIGDGGFRHSIHKSATEILYLPVPSDAKKRTKVLLDTTVDNLATGIGALTVLAALAAGLDYTHLSYVSLALVVLWLGLVLRSRRAYVDTFRRALERREIDLSEYTVDISEAGTLESLVSVLERTDHERHLVYALDMLAAVRAERLVAPVTALLEHPSEEVREKALQVLQLQSGPQAVERFEELLTDDVLGVRVEALHALCIHDGQRPQQRLRDALASPDRDLRSAAVGCIAEYGTEEEQALIDSEMVRGLIDGADTQGMVQAARLLGRIYDPERTWIGELVGVLSADSNPAVLRQLVESLGEAGDATHLPWLADRLEDRRTRRAAAAALARFGDAAAVLLIERASDGSLPPRSRILAARALAGVATPGCIGAVLECAESAPPWLEYQLVKTLSKLRNRAPDLAFDARRVHDRLRRATHGWWELTQAGPLLPDDDGDGAPALRLLRRALEEKRRQYLKRLFRLLALLHPPQDLYNAYLGYASGDRADRASAVEFLENVLDRGERELVVPLLDAPTEAAALAAGAVHFGQPCASADELLDHLLDGDDPWLRACIVFYLKQSSSPVLARRLPELRQDGSRLVRETVGD
jgi:AAA family ATP:ADP antiporter